MAKGQRGYRTISLDLRAGDAVSIFTSPRIADALQEIAAKSTLYEGVRLMQILEAAYKQGKKDGADEAFAQMDSGLAAAKKAIPHGRPGRPAKRRSN